jgi:hypothetical protein
MNDDWQQRKSSARRTVLPPRSLRALRFKPLQDQRCIRLAEDRVAECHSERELSGAGWPCLMGFQVVSCHCLAALGQAVRLVNGQRTRFEPRRHCFRSARRVAIRYDRKTIQVFSNSRETNR